MKHLNEALLMEAKLQPTADALRCAGDFQQFLNDYESGALVINSSKDFTDYARKVDSLNEAYMQYMPYLFVFKHKNGKAWELDELMELYDKTDGLAI